MPDQGFSFVSVKQGTNKSEDFVTFLQKLSNALKNFGDGVTEDVILIFDGAPIHKALVSRDEIFKLWLRGLMMHSHSPGKLDFIMTLIRFVIELNAAEHYIRNHKSIKTRYDLC